MLVLARRTTQSAKHFIVPNHPSNTLKHNLRFPLDPLPSPLRNRSYHNQSFNPPIERVSQVLNRVRKRYPTQSLLGFVNTFGTTRHLIIVWRPNTAIITVVAPSRDFPPLLRGHNRSLVTIGNEFMQVCNLQCPLASYLLFEMF